MARTVFDELAEIDRPVTDFFRSFLAPVGFRPPWLSFGPGRPFMPATDVFARNGDLVVRMDLPGIDPEKDVSVTFDEGELIVKGERKTEREIKEEGYYRKEAAFGSFERHIPLPKTVKEADIKAEYHDGVLEVIIPQAVTTEKPKVKAIPVKATMTKPAAKS